MSRDQLGIVFIVLAVIVALILIFVYVGFLYGMIITVFVLLFTGICLLA